MWMLLKLLIKILLTQSKQSGIATKIDLMKTPSQIIYVKIINVKTIRQRITYLENKNKILHKPHIGKNSLVFNR